MPSSHRPLKRALLAAPVMLALSAGCAPTTEGDTQPDTASLVDTAAEEMGFSVVTSELAQGVLLSAWSDADELLMVGGELGGEGILARYDGDRLCVEEAVADTALWWIHGPRDGEWYAVGSQGRIVHEVDGERTREDVETNATLFGVYADGERVWAVGGDVSNNTGEIWRREDGAWSLFAGDLPGLMFKTWEGWFVGDGQSYRLEGDELVPHDTDGARLVTVRGRDAESDTWAVGGSSSAVVMRFEGEGWEPVEQELGQPLNGVWTAPGEPVYVAGNSGTTAFYQDGQWVKPDAPVTMEVLHAVWPHGDEVIWVGGNLMTTSGDYYGTIVRYGERRDALTPEVCP